MKRCIILLLICLSSLMSTGQEFSVKQYRVEDGLPADIIKSSTQDSLGYFWIATDEGLVKYDGIKFKTYREAMHSNYAKGFLTTRSGRLLAYGDLDFIEIKNLGDTVLFNSVCPVSRIANDSSLSYPKLVFEDIRGALWVSESQSVVRLDNGSFKRYEFDIGNRTPQFLRSFTFFEDKKHGLFVSSFQGNVFRLNPSTDEFESVDKTFPHEVEFVSVFGNKLIIGSSEGVSEAILPDEGGYEYPERTMKIPFVSFVKPINDQEYFIATRGNRHFIANIETNSFSTIPNSINNVNHIYISTEKDIWISGNDGLILMKENLFHVVNENVTDFIECITEDPTTGVIYYATRPTLYAYDPSSKQNKIILDLPAGYFQSLISTKEGIWVANAFRVFLFNNGKIIKEFDFSNKGRFVTAITRDSKGNIWLTIPGRMHAFMIDSSLKLHQYRVPLGQQGAINMIQEGEDGMYICSAGRNSYLFYKAHSDSLFGNISAPLNFPTHNDFNVTNLTITGNSIWLASSEGLIKFDRPHLERMNLGTKNTDLPVSSIHGYLGNKLLVANAFGLLLFDIDTRSYDLFNKSSGLLSKTITTRGIFVSQNEKIWVGTGRGLCYSARPLTKTEKTAQPKFVETSVNGKKLAVATGNKIDHGSFVSLRVSSITFPEDEITFQYRHLPEKLWKTATGSEIYFTALDAGSHMLEVRAKKNGLFSWSDSSYVTFTTTPPFWQRVWFYILGALGVMVLIAVTSAGVSARNRKLNKKLQLLIDERTRELKQSNDELLNLNLEKNNLIGIVAHDLQSPVNQMKGLLSLIRMNGKVDSGAAEYLSLMEKSTARLNKMITKILDTDAIESRQLNVHAVNVNLSELLNNVADRYRVEAAGKNIIIEKQIDDGVFVMTDKDYIEQVFENLISNAVKFSPFGRTVFVNLRTGNKKATCEIRDEGPGLSEDDKKKLFGKYQKLSARPTGNELSTGLGLSIVKKFVKAMNGDIWCESELGKGASFFVSLVHG